MRDLHSESIAGGRVGSSSEQEWDTISRVRETGATLTAHL